MNIQILEGLEGARQSTDIAVIIDVLRAASVSAYLLDAGVASILPVSSADEAFLLKKVNHQLILVGEDQGIKIPGFDIGNSPSEIKLRNDLGGVEAIHRSSTGTQGIIECENAQQIIFGSFVTAGAIVDYLLAQRDRKITLVPMYGIEDHLLAEYLTNSLNGRESLSAEAIKSTLLRQESIQNSFLDQTNLNFPEEDLNLCLEINVFNFFPVVHQGKIIKSTQV